MEKNLTPLVTIFTCVYNRAHTIGRVFSSVNNQTYKNIEHIIIDDGSTDGVWPLIVDYAEKASYPVKILRKENGGKHTATNIAWDMAEGEYIIQLDSDDELLPHAIETLVNLWAEIPDDKKHEYWCVHGRCRSQFDERMIGEPYPKDINQMPKSTAKKVARAISGEKVGLMKRSILRNDKHQFRYPEPVGVKFVSEGVLWKPINEEYRTWYSNNIVRIYYINEGESLTNQKMSSQTRANRCWNSKWILEHRRKYPCNCLRELLKYCIYYPFTTALYRDNNNYYSDYDDELNIILGIMKPIIFFSKVILAEKFKK